MDRPSPHHCTFYCQDGLHAFLVLEGLHIPEDPATTLTHIQEYAAFDYGIHVTHIVRKPEGDLLPGRTCALGPAHPHRAWLAFGTLVPQPEVLSE